MTWRDLENDKFRMTATPMLDKVRKYAKDWGVEIGATHVMELYPPAHVPWTHDGPGIFAIHWPTRRIIEPLAEKPKRGRVATDREWGEIDQATEDLLLSKSLKLAVDAGLLTKQGAPTFNRSAWMPLSMRAEQVALPLARALAAALVEAKRQCG